MGWNQIKVTIIIDLPKFYLIPERKQAFSGFDIISNTGKPTGSF
jgi:hypothetical protein